MRGKLTEWYDNINMKAKFSRGDRAMLEYVKQLIKNSVEAAKNNGDKEKWFSELRNYIHDMASYQFLQPVLIKKSGVLEEDGLPLIFSGPDKDLFPWDVVSDAEALWGRWISGDIDGFILRGIVVTKTVNDKGAKRTTYSIQNPYPAKRSANVPGSNHLQNGQWWPLRICALRDGAHGAIEAGISGQAGSGAYSIVLGPSKSNNYQDEDHGDVSSLPSLPIHPQPNLPPPDNPLLRDQVRHAHPNRRYSPARESLFDARPDPRPPSRQAGVKVRAQGGRAVRRAVRDFWLRGPGPGNRVEAVLAAATRGSGSDPLSRRRGPPDEPGVKGSHEYPEGFVGACVTAVTFSFFYPPKPNPGRESSDREHDTDDAMTMMTF